MSWWLVSWACGGFWLALDNRAGPVQGRVEPPTFRF
jgi:hypothetical protein